MNDLKSCLENIFSPLTIKCVLSNSTSPKNEPRLLFRGVQDYFQREIICDKKAYHINLSFQECFDFVYNSMNNDYLQFHCWDSSFEYSLKITKKGKILQTKRSTDKKNQPTLHNREKNHLLTEDNISNFDSIKNILIDLSVISSDGKLIKSKQDKFRQINRFLEIIYDEIKSWDNSQIINIVDFGCGKSYLSFLLFHFLTDIKGLRVKMTGVDSNLEIIKKCKQIAEKNIEKNKCVSHLKFNENEINFVCSDIFSYQPQNPINIVISLHACDIATDHVLYFAIQNNAKAIFAVPCCQHEINTQLKKDSFPLINKHGLIKERFSALVTDAIRANVLESCGYKTQLIDFVDLENTAKNILIRAVKSYISEKSRKKALSEVEEFVKKYEVIPEIYRLLYLNN
ncbi:MAG: SAM-dependent methyltransferase [Candidatus Cloacimonetes bacterium]|nr:SAM-dependent methyltransferase [Candidatus Cloacimonadota bacterium]